jgi:hypothetical protein
VARNMRMFNGIVNRKPGKEYVLEVLEYNPYEHNYMHRSLGNLSKTINYKNICNSI